MSKYGPEITLYLDTFHVVHFRLAEIRIVEGRADFEWKYKTTRSGFL